MATVFKRLAQYISGLTNTEVIYSLTILTDYFFYYLTSLKSDFQAVESVACPSFRKAMKAGRPVHIDSVST